jgi:uncharacterized small protein (DUF1192 family)
MKTLTIEIFTIEIGEYGNDIYPVIKGAEGLSVAELHEARMAIQNLEYPRRIAEATKKDEETHV